MKAFFLLLIFFSLSGQGKKIDCSSCHGKKPIEVLVCGQISQSNHATVIAGSLASLGKKTALHSEISSKGKKRKLYKKLRSLNILPFIQVGKKTQIPPLSWNQASWLHIDGSAFSPQVVLNFCTQAKENHLKSSLYISDVFPIDQKLLSCLDILIVETKEIWNKKKIQPYINGPSICLFVDDKGIWIKASKRGYMIFLEGDSDYFIAGMLFGILREKPLEESIWLGKLLSFYQKDHEKLPWDQIKKRIQLEESMVEKKFCLEDKLVF